MEEIKVSEMLQADSINKDDSVMIIQEGVNKKASGSIQTATGTSLSLTSVADTCKVTSNSKNLFDKDNLIPVYYANNASYSILENGIRITKPSSGATSVVFRIMDVSDKVGETFTLKADFASGGQYILGLCDVNGGNRIIGTIGTTGGTEINYTIPTITTSSYLAIWLYGDSNTTGNKDYTNIQLEEGSTATSYNPYNIEVGIFGKNLFDQSQIVNPPAGGVTPSIILKLKPNTAYIMSTNCVKSVDDTTLIFFASGTSSVGLSTAVNGVWKGQTRTFTSDANGNMIVVYRRNGRDTDVDLTDYWYQVEEGSTATTYEKFEGQYLDLIPDEIKSAFTYDSLTNILSNGSVTIEYNTQSRLLNNDDVLDIVEPVKEYVDREIDNRKSSYTSYSGTTATLQTITGTTAVTIANMSVNIKTTGKPLFVATSFFARTSNASYSALAKVYVDGVEKVSRLNTIISTSDIPYTGMVLLENISAGNHTIEIKIAGENANSNITLPTWYTRYLNVWEIN